MRSKQTNDQLLQYTFSSSSNYSSSNYTSSNNADRCVTFCWLFLLEHKLELMCSSIVNKLPAVCQCFPVNRFIVLCIVNMYPYPPSILNGQLNDQPAHAHRLSANQLHVGLSCLRWLKNIDRSRSSHTVQFCCLTQAFISLPTHHGQFLYIKKKLYAVIVLINGLGDQCCWRQPFSPTLKRCLGYLAWVRNGGHIHFPSLSSLQELGIGTRHSASVPHDTHLMV